MKMLDLGLVEETSKIMSKGNGKTINELEKNGTLVLNNGETILKEDVEKYISSILNGQNQIKSYGSDIDFSIFGPVEIKRLNKFKISTRSTRKISSGSLPHAANQQPQSFGFAPYYGWYRLRGAG